MPPSARRPCKQAALPPTPDAPSWQDAAARIRQRHEAEAKGSAGSLPTATRGPAPHASQCLDSQDSHAQKGHFLTAERQGPRLPGLPENSCAALGSLLALSPYPHIPKT